MLIYSWQIFYISYFVKQYLKLLVILDVQGFVMFGNRTDGGIYWGKKPNNLCVPLD